MEHRTAATWQRLPIVTLLISSCAIIGCTRGERTAVPSADGRPPASSRPSSQPERPLPPAGLVIESPGKVGFDSLIKQQRPQYSCYIGARYVVVERELDDQVGADLYVRPRGLPDIAPRCDADSVGGDIVFRTGTAASRHPDAQHFMGLKGNLLFAWDGTGAASDLYIYNLNTRANALFIEGVDDRLEWLSPTTVGVWVTKAYADSAVAAGCPDTLPANPAEMDSLMSLDLERLTLRPTGRYRCGVSQ
jgi:hypothetical protein